MYMCLSIWCLSVLHYIWKWSDWLKTMVSIQPYLAGGEKQGT